MMACAIAFSSLIVTAASPAQSGKDGWVVPEEYRALPNPVPPSPEAAANGRVIYERQCRSCHGDTGKGDGKMSSYIKPAPKDLSMPELQDKMTDGEVFYKITYGRSPMPQFKQKLSDQERWHLVHYIRTLRVRRPTS
jgi:mono/diheme cytochrome c family protein